MAIRVIIAEDDVSVREAVTDLVGDEPDLELVGTADATDTAIQLCLERRPDVVLLDMRMPGGGGPRVAEVIKERGLPIQIVGLSAFASPAIVREMFRLGAAGYVIKGAAGKEIVEAVRRAARRQLSVSADLALAAFQDLIRAVDQCQEIESRLKDGEQRFESVLDASPAAAVVVDSEETIRYANVRAEEVFACPRAGLVGTRLEDLVPERFREVLRGERERCTVDTTSRSQVLEAISAGRRRDGTEFAADVAMSSLAGASPLWLVTFQQGIAEVQRRRLLAQLVRAQEDERLRIASDIHDDSVQAITAAALRVQRLQRRLTDDGLREELRTVEAVMQKAIEGLRHLMFELRPPALADEGLTAAVRTYLEQFQMETGVQHHLSGRIVREPPLETSMLLYRAAQELLVDVRGHAGARSVRVEIQETGGGYLLMVADDGRRSKPGGPETAPGHQGVVALCERVDLAGGWCRFEGQPGAGATTRVWVPAPGSRQPPGAEAAEQRPYLDGTPAGPWPG